MERDSGMFRTCLLLALLLPVGVADQFLIVRNGAKVTLPCKQQGPDCSRIDWVFTGMQVIRLVHAGTVYQTAVDAHLFLTTDCSLEIMEITENLVGQFSCRVTDPYQQLQLFRLSVVSLTRPDGHQLSCSITSQDSHRYKVKWLYKGEPYPKVELGYGERQTVTVGEESQKLFSCQVRSSEEEIQFPLIDHSGGHVATTPTSTKWSCATGNSGTTDPDKEPQLAVPSWWPFAVAAAAVTLLSVLVVVIICHRAKGKKTKQEDEDINHLYEQMHQRKSNPVVDDSCLREQQQVAEPGDGISYASISYIERRPKVTLQVMDEDDKGDAVTYSTVKVSRR